ncbi:MAG: GxxExxY protein [Planctomycetes bacterium]|nr:GxxExxY protein [Planctomycetota bacterium]
MSNWSDQDLNALTERVIGLCIAVHRALGPGLLETAYAACLAYELNRSDIAFKREEPLPIQYEDVKLDCGYRLDFVIEDVLILELKAVERLERIHQAQVLTYLKLSGKPIALLINFNVPMLKDGIVRLRK